ncbi:MAG TPA: glycerophosphodiester phosphodiesterase [Longimicrobium sp.]|nr:glycerophosphodiester phosphodiesterase [Longimicrobium sp.]
MADGNPPLVIAHRGASGYRPEHTLASYALAIQMGADFVEPDLVSTRDGVLVCRHENEIGGTTDVAAHPEFAARRTTKVVDGVAMEGWFTEDFTLAELKTLRARERLPQLRPRNAELDGRFEVPTLEEVIALVQRESAARGRTIGIYPETKHPTYFQSIGLGLEDPLLAALERVGWTGADAPVFIQLFETANLRMLRGRTGVRLVQLMEAQGRPYDFTARGEARTYADLATPAGLAEIATYADAIGPDKSMVIPRDGDGRLLPPAPLVADAHAALLDVHPWTLRSENYFLPADLRAGDPADPFFLRLHGDAQAEAAAFFAAGVDGVFADFPDVALRARAAIS